VNDANTAPVLVLLWSAVLLHAWTRDEFAQPRRPALPAVALLAVTLALGAWLERQVAWRAFDVPIVGAAGMVLVWAGAVLHVQARRALGAHWSPTVAPSDPGHLMRTGPYAVVRHPLYAALVVMAIGTALAHPSVPVLAGTGGMVTGLGLKVLAEERALRQTFGADWDAYARRVPALLPRPFRRGRHP
jgi:protein-S-isoprenylcysteine O-methyltransferase Ste14